MSPDNTSFGDLATTRLKREVADRAEDLFRMLYGEPTAHRRGRELRWGRRGSLVLYLRGRTGPHWHDYEAGTGGDMLAAIQHALGLDFSGAVRWARDWLRLDVDDRPRAARRIPGVKSIVDYDTRVAESTRRIADLVAAARPIDGTLANIYLQQHRGIQANTWPEALGAVDAATVQRCLGWPWWHWSALVARATDASGIVTGVQMVALKPDGRAAQYWDHAGKLKLSYGTLRDTAVRLPGDKRALLLAEGTETALSCWWATGIEAWANLGSIAKAPLDQVPLDRKMVVCADDDARNAQSNKGQRDAIRKWRRQGRQVVLVKPHGLTRGDKTDFNDLLQAKGREAVRVRILNALARPPGLASLARVDEARQRSTELINACFEELLVRHLLEDPFSRYGATVANDDEADAAPFKVVRVATGLGKTEAAVRRAVKTAAGEAKIVYLVPTHELAVELATRITAEAQRQVVTVPVEVWRGRAAKRPDFPAETMCGALEVVAEAQKARLDVAEIVCKVCPAAGACPYLAQQQRPAAIWIGAHELLFHAVPAPMKGADLLIIDENFATRGLIGITVPVRLTKVELAAVPSTKSVSLEADLRTELMPLRQRAQEALQGHPNGGLVRQRLLDAGLTAEDARVAAKLEWLAKIEPGTKGLTWPSVCQAIARAAQRNRQIPRLAMLWHVISGLLAENGPAISGRAIIGADEIDGSLVRLYGAEEIAADWRRMPTLHIDATVDMSLLRCRVPHAQLVGTVEAEGLHMRVIQYADHAFGKMALRNERTLFRTWDWAVAHASRQGGHWALILPKEAQEKVLARGTVPSFIRIHHFGALRGLDGLRDVRGLIVIGRPMAPPREVERIAGVLSGWAVEPAAGDWYPAEIVQLHARDGSTMSVETDRHPDALTEAVRRSIAEAELVQAIGRCRGLNRTAADPVEVVLLTNVSVPGLLPNQLRQWDGPSIDDELLAQHGAVLESAGDAAEAAGLTRRQVKDRRRRLDAFSYKRSLYENASNLCRAEYQRAGPGRSRQRIVYDLRRIPDCRAWLAERLGPLTYFGAEPAAKSVAENVLVLPVGPAFAARRSRRIAARCPRLCRRHYAVERHGLVTRTPTSGRAQPGGRCATYRGVTAPACECRGRQIWLITGGGCAAPVDGWWTRAAAEDNVVRHRHRAKATPATTEPVKPYEPTRKERNAVQAYRDRLRREKPQIRAKASLEPDHPDPAFGHLLLLTALGSTQIDFSLGLLAQLANAASKGRTVDERQLNFMLAMVTGIEPRDQLEAMLAAQMAAVHNATMTFARRLNHVDNIPQQDSAERAFNKLARTFACQLQALKAYRSTGQQHVTVTHLNVAAHQAQVNVGGLPGGGGIGKSQDQPHAPALDHEPGTPVPCPDPEREAVPVAGRQR